MKCLALTQTGAICGQPAIVLDKARGCMVCAEHAPKVPGAKMEAEKRGKGETGINFKRRMA